MESPVSELKRVLGGWGGSAVVECLPSARKGPGFQARCHKTPNNWHQRRGVVFFSPVEPDALLWRQNVVYLPELL